MKKTITKNEFINEFKSVRPENFSYEGLDALFEYFEELEEMGVDEFEFDPIAICCEFSEYDSAIEIASQYFDFEGMHFDEEGNETETVEEVEEKALEFLREHTLVIEFQGRVIIQDF
jgi:hypothetical protein